ncbi:VOC family protein [Shewanella sp. C32]|uniref:VOC family protein n=1 Tax=Shewanella electrica TaxID=515560 RepID=A0ABT2FFT6_9GAMM|nr:VOC family protein [Shewanella electrica]MCH1925243.1 VOC family protein [Shewanella electrica]MCS4555068.1 VOC family protein [Shewanella electrica]
MHKSKLAGFIIDCHTADLRSASLFWSEALGMPTHSATSAGNQYVQLLDPNSQLHIEVQQVDHPSRVHLDIETNDIAAEVKRLERLGAKVIKLLKTWCVMKAPTGQRFCVVNNSSPNFEQQATAWD